MCQESLLLTRCHCFRFKMHSVVRFIYLHTVHDFLRVWVGECGEAGAMLVLAVPNVKSIWPSASHHQSRHRDWALGTRYQGSHDYHNNLSIHSTSFVFLHTLHLTLIHLSICCYIEAWDFIFLASSFAEKETELKQIFGFWLKSSPSNIRILISNFCTWDIFIFGYVFTSLYSNIWIRTKYSLHLC